MKPSWLAGAAVLALATLALDAEARVGGGQGFSTGSTSSRSSGGSSGGGGGDAEVIFLLLRLLFYYPEIGVPIVILLVGYAIYANRKGASDAPRVTSATHAPVADRVVRHQPLGELAKVDPGFSRHALEEQVALIVRRAWAARSDDFVALSPYVRPALADTITRSHPDGPVSEVAIGSVRLAEGRAGGEEQKIVADITASRLEGSSRTYVEERWTFARPQGVVSRPPDEVMRLGCPACGAAVQTDTMGRCTSCSTPIAEGQRSWQAVNVQQRVRRAVQAPTLSIWNGGAEPGFHAPTVVDADLSTELRAFGGRHPDFDLAAWQSRVQTIFLGLQEVWSSGRWADARPWTTDNAWNTLRFWMDAYAAAGLKNRADDVTILKLQVVAVRMDAWYEHVTVRFWARMKDWVEDRQGQVVGGSRTQDRSFSEYWTFVRAVGSGSAVHDARRCPSCGAPADKINAAGVCGYCDSVVTTGRFDWVLSRIEQAEGWTP